MIFTNGDVPLQKQFSVDEFCEDPIYIYLNTSILQ